MIFFSVCMTTQKSFLVKESWNAQVICVTSAIIQSNLPDKLIQFVATNVFGYKNEHK